MLSKLVNQNRKHTQIIWKYIYFLVIFELFTSYFWFILLDLFSNYINSWCYIFYIFSMVGVIKKENEQRRLVMISII
jgi:hypothetical protein